MEEYASSCGGKERELSGIEDGSAGLHDPLPVSSSFPPGVFSLPNFLHINGTSFLSVYWVKWNETSRGHIVTNQSRHVYFQGIHF